MVRRPAWLLVILFFTSVPAHAADWLLIQGTEVGAPDTWIRPTVILQGIASGVFSRPVEGLESLALVGFNGRRAAFNLLDPRASESARWGFGLRRVRPGIRGSIPGTKQRINYFLSIEAGDTALTRIDSVVLVDASATFSYIPGVRVRIGQFKLPIVDEGLENVPAVGEFINFSNVTFQLLQEFKVANGAYVSGAYGFRDLGIQVFDTFRLGHLGLSYAIVLSNGRMGRLDDDKDKDITGRLQASWIFRGQANDVRRQELSLFGWTNYGHRSIDGERTRRLRSGGGIHLELSSVRFRGEVVYGDGALILGQNPPFSGQPVAVSLHGRAIGWYVQGTGVLFHAHLRLSLRYDELYRQWNETVPRRDFRSLTAGIEFAPIARVRIQANYEKRWLAAPGANADVQRIVDTIGDRLIAQATLVW